MVKIRERIWRACGEMLEEPIIRWYGRSRRCHIVTDVCLGNIICVGAVTVVTVIIIGSYVSLSLVM